VSGGARVLAVDDRPENLVALEAILQGLPVEIATVTSGDEALKRLLLEDYAVILLDAQMPGMDGFETASHIKQRERTSHIPIVFLTAANYDPHLAFRGYQLGAVDYLTKPFDPWVLRSKVQVFIDLWKLNAELAARAEGSAALEKAVTETLDLLSGEDSPAELVAQAKARLAAVLPYLAHPGRASRYRG
jgi:CheY-like chemotaxis protein